MSQQYIPVQRQQSQPAAQVPMSMENQIQRMKMEFARAIGGATPQEQQKRAERFTRICITAFRQNPDLQKCSPASILGAMMTCAQLNLEPNTPSGLCYLIPRWNSRLRSMECQFQVGYHGLLELMYRSGAVASFNADVVYAGEIQAGLFQYTSGVRPNIEHHIDLLDNSARTGDPKDIVAAYACAVLKSGEPVIRLVTRRDIDAAMALSGKRESGPSAVWKEHYKSMAIKTAIKRLAQWLPSTRMDEAIAAEGVQAEPEQVKAEVQTGLSLDTMNAMMNAGTQQAVPAPQEAPAIEQAPAPQPEPAQAQPVQQTAPAQKPAGRTRKQAAAPAPEPKPEPTPEPQPEAPAPEQDEYPMPEDPAMIEQGYIEYLADCNIPSKQAWETVTELVNSGQCKSTLEAKWYYQTRGLGA